MAGTPTAAVVTIGLPKVFDAERITKIYDGMSEMARMHDVIRESHTERQTTLLVRANGHVYDSRWQLHEVDFEEIVLGYLGHRGTSALARNSIREVVAR